MERYNGLKGYAKKKYLTDKDGLKEILEEFGVAIIPSILNDEECESLSKGMWDFFEHITQKMEIPLDRNDKKTWRTLYDLYPLHSMLYQHWSIGHAQFSWDVRQNEKVVDIFSHFWKCSKEELLVSFDGASFNVPPEITNRGWNRNNVWLHTDQSYTRPNFECVQSWITALDVNKGDATLGFLEGSHKFHEEFAEKFNITSKGNWFRINNEEYLNFYLEKGCKLKKIMCPKGSLVLWDSRTIHCGIEATKERELPNFRNVVYICYSPRSLARKTDLKKKLKAFDELRTTTHWPSKPKLFSKVPRTYGNDIPNVSQINPPVLNELGKKLAGF
tara:strand:- start:14594 stop:15586 length:993 start_codon:yes stop_codon:yes gene_type:complete